MERFPWRYAYDGRGDERSLETAQWPDGADGRTVQSGKDDADINVIVRRFGIGANAPAPLRLPEFGDFTGIEDYQSALNQVIAGREAFDALPATVRARFGNDPGALWQFLHTPGNEDEARELGLLEPESPAPAPMRVEVVNPPTPEAEPAR